MNNLHSQSDLDKLGYVISHNTHSNWKMDSYHFHEFYEINFTLSDGVSWFVADQVHQVKRGTLMILRDGELHRTVSPPGTDYERYVLYVSPRYLEALSTPITNLQDCFMNLRPEDPPCVQLTEKQAGQLLVLLRRAESTPYAEVYGRDLYRQIVLIEILLLINELRSAAMPRPPRIREDLQRVLPVIAFIQQHLQDDLSLDRLSGIFYINKYHLGRLFKQATGFTINEYIIHRRILRSRELLRQNMPVYQVGRSVGFNNNSHFIRTFRQLVGITPKQYQLSVKAD